VAAQGLGGFAAVSHIVINDLPKVESLKTMFPDRYRATPVLVSAGGSN
jgi:peptide-methionine (S)-S-oxide reductase